MPVRERKDDLREALIRRRLAIDDDRRRRADAAIAQAVLALIEQHRARTIAAFIAHRGEPDLAGALERLDAAGRSVYLPVVRGRRMHFCRWQPGAEMKPNRFGIPEPAGAQERAPSRLDLVLVPLVGFSPAGARLGMGAGFYDRAFAFRRGRPGALPRLVGIAYSAQQLEALPQDAWDVPLDGVATELGLRWFDRV